MLILQICALAALLALSAAALLWMAERIRAERLKNVWKWACIAVQAAERRFGPEEAERKRGAAMELLRSRYPRADARALEALAEAAARELL